MSKFRIGDRVRALVTEFDVREGGVYEVDSIGEDGGVRIIDDVGDAYFMYDEQVEPITATPEYKKGDRVRLVKDGLSTIGAVGKLATIDSWAKELKSISGEYLLKIDPPVDYETLACMPEFTRATADCFVPADDAPIRIEAGKYYLTRDGRKVGPASTGDGGSLYPKCHWAVDGVLYQDDGTFADGNTPSHDLISESPAPKGNPAAEVDNLRDEYGPVTGDTVAVAAQGTGNDNAPKFKVGDRVRYEGGKCEGIGVIHSDNDAANGYGWFVTVEEKDRDHAPFDDNTTRIFNEDVLRLVAPATSGSTNSTAGFTVPLDAPEFAEKDGDLIIKVSVDTTDAKAALKKLSKKIKKLTKAARELHTTLAA